MKPSKKAWKPKGGELIWSMSMAFEGIRIGQYHYGDAAYSLMPYFRTRKAAQKAARVVREVLKNSDKG